MLIDVKDLYKIYNEGKESEVRALDGVTLSIDRGEFVAIIGASGSGKSTLMNVLGCLDLPTRGSYHLNGKLASRMNDDELSPTGTISSTAPTSTTAPTGSWPTSATRRSALSSRATT